MKNRQSLGILIGALWLAGIMALGASLPGLDPIRVKLEELPIRLPKVSKPELVRDREEVVKVMKVARQVPRDFNYLLKQYDQIPVFNPKRDPHLSADQVERFIIAYDSYVKEMENFTNNTVGPNPGVFRAIAVAGMIENFHQVVRTRALVRANLSYEEFSWIQVRLMEAGLFAVLSALEDGQYENQVQLEHLESLRDAMYKSVGAFTKDDKGKITYHPEKYDRNSIPRGNLVLFLDYYRRPNQPGINWPQIHFHRPTIITFDRERILAKAVGNPP